MTVRAEGRAMNVLVLYGDKQLGFGLYTTPTAEMVAAKLNEAIAFAVAEERKRILDIFEDERVWESTSSYIAAVRRAEAGSHQ